MKVLILILGSLVALVCLSLLVALFMKTDYKIQREVIIDRPQQQVFSYVSLLKNQDYYSKWVMADPNMKKDFDKEDGKEGFIYAWDSEDKHVGKGEQEIVKIVDGKQVDAEVRFSKPFESVATTSMMIESLSDQQSKVSWSMSGENNFPMNLMNPFMDNLLGNDLQTSLLNLKQILEK